DTASPPQAAPWAASFLIGGGDLPHYPSIRSRLEGTPLWKMRGKRIPSITISAALSEPLVYFAFTGGERLGPLSYAELDGLAAHGRLQPEDLVWQSGTPDWVPAS